MKGKLFQPVVFNLITIVAMLFTLFQVAAVSLNTATSEVIELIEEFREEGDIEDAVLSARLELERQYHLRLAIYILIALMIAILANVVPNYFGRGRQIEDTTRIRELEAEIRGLQENR